MIRRLQPKLAKVEGITLFMQPVQDLTVEDRVSRTQYQYSLEDADAERAERTGRRSWSRSCRRCPSCATSRATSRPAACRPTLVIDRDTASRLGITPQTIDDTLYDAFGQRQVSTMFTQLNQYHVVLEVEPEFQTHARAIAQATSTSRVRDRRQQVPLSAVHVSFEQSTRAAGDQPSGAVPGGHALVQSRARRLAGRRGDGDRRRRSSEIGLPASIQASFQGTAQAFQASLANEPLLILAALITVYIVLGVLYESYIHPITILSTLPSAGVGASGAADLPATTSSVIALIGIILLIGIVKKNAIMMIDFALEAERNEGKPPDDAIYQACLLRFRPIMMTTMAALLGGVPLAFGTRHRLGAAPAARHHDHRRPDRQPGADALHDAGDLPPSTAWRSGCVQRRLRRGWRAEPVPAMAAVADEPLRALHPAAGRDDAADRRRSRWRASSRSRLLPVSPLPQVDFPRSQCQRSLPGASPETMASVGGDAARAPVRPHRRRDGNDLDQLARLDQRSRCSSI